MLLKVSDYEKIKGKTLAEEESAKVEALLEAVLSSIENTLGYPLAETETTEIYPFSKFIYLNNRPVYEVKKVDTQEHWREGKNYIEFPNFEECPCRSDKREVAITYKAGYKELPKWLKYEIYSLTNIFLESTKEESKYKSYKIDDISYSLHDFVANKNEKLQEIARKIYG